MNLSRWWHAVAVGALFAVAPAFAQPTSGIVRADIDARIRPQDDFYRNANGAWLKRAVFPADKSYIGPAQEMHDRIQTQLRVLVAEAQRRTGDTAATQLVDLYASFMDEAGVSGRGVTPLATELASIAAVTDPKELGTLFAHLGQIGVESPMGLAISQDDRDATRYVPSLVQAGLGLPSRDYYLKLDDATFRGVRQKYVAYLAKLLALADGRGARANEPTAQAILALETELARAQWDPVENRDPVKSYNPVALTDLPALAPAVDWPGFVAATGLAGKTSNVLVRQPSYWRGWSPLLNSVSLEAWKAYARVRLLDAYAPYLGKDFVDARFAFAGKVLAGTTQNQPRWKRGIRLVDESLGESLGRLYVDAHFPPASKRRIETMVANLLATYRERVAALDWMGSETRQQALDKLAKFHVKIGYPSRWIDYSSIAIRRDDLVGNVMRARRFEDARQIAKLGQPIDREEWGMTPQTVNAYYDASMNEIVFPAAFLQAPNFVPEADDAANYGAIGATIGHEISHGFDDEGSQYDGDGNLRDWWTAEDRARFQARTALLVKQYSAFVAVPPDYHVNGELTLGENIADNVGLAMAYRAWQRSLGDVVSPVIDGLTGDQRFFYGFAQTWRGKSRDAALLAQIKSDPHAPDEFRVIGAARNHPAFYPTFGVKPGDKMYLAPADRASIW